jgi:hypothetical protein
VSAAAEDVPTGGVVSAVGVLLQEITRRSGMAPYGKPRGEGSVSIVGGGYLAGALNETGVLDLARGRP